MNILVTGSTGFLGAHLCRALLERGHSVSAFHRTSSPLHLLEGLDVRHIIGDLARPETLEGILNGMEAVFHAGGLVNGRFESVDELMSVTVGGTRALLQAALRSGVRRFVYTSSASALGLPTRAPFPGAAPVLMDETHAWNGDPRRNPYGYAKHLAEKEVQKAVAQGLDAFILNPSLVFGAGDIHRKNSSLVVQAARRLPALVEGGMNVVHVDDVVEGHLAALLHGQRGERYLLGGENMTYQHMLRLIHEVCGAPVPDLVFPGWLGRALARPAGRLQALLPPSLPVHQLPMAGYHFYLDCAKARRDLHLPAPRPALQAFEDACRWFHDNGVM